MAKTISVISGLSAVLVEGQISGIFCQEPGAVLGG